LLRRESAGNAGHKHIAVSEATLDGSVGGSRIRPAAPAFPRLAPHFQLPVCVRAPLVWRLQRAHHRCGILTLSRMEELAMRPLQMLGLGQLFNANPMLAQPDGGSSAGKLQRRLAALAHAAQEVNMRPVAEMRAEWLRRAAQASRQQELDPRLRAAR